MVRRGCGTRHRNALYVCVGTSPFGKPLEYFMVDPPKPWKGPKTVRAPMLIQDRNGINHILLGIGKEFYPYPSDFLEEARLYGVSKRFPRNFDFSVLTPGKSKLVLMHPRAIPLFDYKTKHFCPRVKNKYRDGSRITASMAKGYSPEKPHQCLGATYSLSLLDNVEEKHEVSIENGIGKVRTPSCTYDHPIPESPKSLDGKKWQLGIILVFPSFHFEWVGEKAPPKIKRKIEKVGFSLEVKDE